MWKAVRIVYRWSVWNTFLILFLPLSVVSQSKVFTVLGKLPCPASQEPLWQSLLHQLGWDWIPFTVTHSHSHSQRRFPYRLDPRFLIAEPQMSRPLQWFNHSAITKHLNSRSGCLWGGIPNRRMPALLYSQSKHGKVWELWAPTVSQCPVTCHRYLRPLLCKGLALPALFLRAWAGTPALPPELNLQLAHWTPALNVFLDSWATSPAICTLPSLISQK